MSDVLSRCLACDATLPLALESDGGVELRCPACATRQRHFLFPTSTGSGPSTSEGVYSDDNAVCYFHDTSAAQTLCDDCGRYLCGLCQPDLPQPANRPKEFPKTVCPSCFAHRMKAEEGAPWDLMATTYLRYDLMALYLALIPLVLGITFLLTPLTAPIALYLALRYWGRSRNPVKRYYLNSVLAVFLVMGVLLIWVAFIALVVAGLWGVA